MNIVAMIRLLCCILNCVVFLIQGDDSVIDCVFDDETGTVVIQASVNTGYSNEVLSNVSQLSSC